MGRISEDAHSATGTLPRGRSSRLRARQAIAIALAVVYWAIAVLKGTSGGYEIAGVATAWLLVDAARPWMHSRGIPEWTANEAYITRWRRWRHSRHATTD
jgi:hypothetical protein